jgi:predicted  nucleic acid-binding Zn-ribbon protein
MQIDPNQLVQWATMVAGFGGSFFVLKHQAKTAEKRLDKFESELKEARDLALKAHGADENIDKRITAIETSVNELKRDNAASFKQMQAMLGDALKDMKDLVGSISRRQYELREEFLKQFHEIDKSKVSTASLEAVKETVEKIETGQYPAYRPPPQRRRDSRRDPSEPPGSSER